MTKSAKITSLKGVEITLTASAYGVDASFSLNGKNHSFNGIKRGHNTAVGNFLDFGPAKAAIDDANAAIAKDVFDEHAALSAEWAKQYKDSDEFKADKFSADMHRRMYGRNSSH